LRTILAGFAEYEREVISERIRAGIARARAAGKRWGGRKEGVRPKLTRQTLRSIATLLKSGTPKAEIARLLHLDRSTVYEAMRLVSMG
jgi:putative DNA-invertase from lambdoid prophage Rac